MFATRLNITTSAPIHSALLEKRGLRAGSQKNAGLTLKPQNVLMRHKLTNTKTSGKRSLTEAYEKSTAPPAKKAHVNPLPRAVLELRNEFKNRELEFVCGKHPALQSAERKNQQLTKKIGRIGEMAEFWKRKSMSLADDLNRSRTEISLLRNKLENVEAERLELQSKLLAAQHDNSECMKAIESLMSDNEHLKFVAKNVNEELKSLQDCGPEEKCDVSMAEADVAGAVDMEPCKELEEALEDTLADLTERIEEIEELKAALARTTVERDELQKVVSKEVIQSAIANLEQNAATTETDPTKQRIIVLQGQVEKCMFRIAVLTQKNAELKKVAMGGSEARSKLLSTLEDSQKLEVLESLCMQRYRKLLRKTAARLVESGDDEELAEESFDF